MKMHLDKSAANLVTDYGVGYININDARYESPLVVNAVSVSDSWKREIVSDLIISDFEPVLALKPEIILLGTGRTHTFPEPQLMAELFTRGCALEVMSTSAACRTYNVLVSEFREVTAVLLPIRE